MAPSLPLPENYPMNLEINPSVSRIALVDCNNFFCSCERVFDPSLIGKPVVVLSNNDGCIISRSQEAKDIGIPMGAPLHQQQEMIRKHGTGSRHR